MFGVTTPEVDASKYPLNFLRPFFSSSSFFLDMSTARLADSEPPISHLWALLLSCAGQVLIVCVKVRKHLETNHEIEAYVFHATGYGGKAMERLVRQGTLDAVLDLTTTTEICDHITGGVMSARRAGSTRGSSQIWNAIHIVGWSSRHEQLQAKTHCAGCSMSTTPSSRSCDPRRKSLVRLGSSYEDACRSGYHSAA